MNVACDIVDAAPAEYPRFRELTGEPPRLDGGEVRRGLLRGSRWA